MTILIGLVLGLTLQTLLIQAQSPCDQVTCLPGQQCEVQTFTCGTANCPDPIGVCVDRPAVDPRCAAVSCPVGSECRVDPTVQCPQPPCQAAISCVPTSAEKPGSCPVAPPGLITTCDVLCSSDQSCPADQKCCSFGCRVQCMAPLTNPTINPCAAALCAPNTVCEVRNGAAVCVNPCDTVRCGFGTECQLRNGRPACVDPCENKNCPSSAPVCEVRQTNCSQPPCPSRAHCVDPCTRVDCPSDRPVCRLQRVQCVRGPCPPIPTCVAAPVDVCQLSRDVGPCDALIPRFYFDSQAGRCQPFNFGGCLGNDNNFQSMMECETRCPDREDPPTPVTNPGYCRRMSFCYFARGCRSDADCGTRLKCCGSACGNVCTRPTLTRPTRPIRCGFWQRWFGYC